MWETSYSTVSPVTLILSWYEARGQPRDNTVAEVSTRGYPARSLFDQAIINYRQLAIVNYIGGGARTCNQAVNYIVLTACQWNVQIDVRRRTLNATFR